MEHQAAILKYKVSPFQSSGNIKFHKSNPIFFKKIINSNKYTEYEK